MKPYQYDDGLKSERTVTRMLVDEDFKPWTEFLADKDAVEFFPLAGFNSAEERSIYWINKQLARYADEKYGLQAILNKNTGELIGQCGLMAQEVDGIAELEVGYHIFKKFWGQGYAPEVAKMFINYAFQRDLASSIISIIDIRNVKSQRVAEKNGLIRDKQTTWLGLDIYVYRLNKEDWQAR
jgi:ribosomal-protein-alanine N-acetyltransferase